MTDHRITRREFERRKHRLLAGHRRLVLLKNRRCSDHNGIFFRYAHPVLTAEHIPVNWRYDMNAATNPLLLERMGVNATFNSGAVEYRGRILLIVRVEGVDRKSFFAVAESASGVDRFHFWEYPIVMPETENPDVNVYDMRVTRHEDGWYYGVFCTERKDPSSSEGDMASAIARCGIARTKDFKTWQRLPDLKTESPQQRNVVLHPEFVQGKYGFYTRPQDDFIEAGSGGGIAWGLAADIENAVIDDEMIVDDRVYHTIKEAKNGLGPPPLWTEKGWLHLAHGVRNTAAGLRYVLYMFLSDLEEPWKIIARPGGYFLAPQGDERVGDVSNVVFSNGWVVRKNGEVMIYYGSSDTRIHVATSTLDRLLDYVLHTPEDGLRTGASVQKRIELIQSNRPLSKGSRKR